MKKLTASIIFLFVLFGTFKAQTFQFDSISFKSMEIGKVMIENNSWIIRVEKGSFNSDYWPVNLPEKFMTPGQEVVFEGAIGRIPQNAKLAGTPIELSMIRILYRTKQNDTNGEKIVTEETKNTIVQNDSVGFINKETGKIILIGDVYLIEQNNNGEIKRFVPDFLPDDFKVENTTITFSGTIGKIPANVRMMGTPLKIKELRFEEEIPFDNSQLQEPIKEFYPFDSVAYLNPIKATIKLMSSDPEVFIIEIAEENNSVKRYLPAILPEAFKKDGLSITVSGNIGKIPANVRLMGTPLDVKSIALNTK